MSQPDPDPTPFIALKAAIEAVIVPPLGRLASRLNPLIPSWLLRLLGVNPLCRYWAMRSALREIAERSGGNYCESTVSYYNGRPCTSTCRAPNSGRTRVATYGAYRWCDSCVAADALGLPPHAHPDAVDRWSD